MQWIPWRPLHLKVSFTAKSLGETLDGGQSFRWNQSRDGNWIGQWSQCLARVRLDSKNNLEWSCPSQLKTLVEIEIARYFATDNNYLSIIDQLPWRSDKILAEAIKSLEGLRILGQPLSETLLTFLCSSTKRISQIKIICDTLAENYGELIAGQYRALPTWETLNTISEKELRACKIGYRARFIKDTARILVERPNFLSETKRRPYNEARSAFMELPGVGEKIADCVLLFGDGRLEAFPVDVWMLKAMARHYGLDGWKPAQVSQFGRAHFGSYAGYAQQFLFAGERRR